MSGHRSSALQSGLFAEESGRIFAREAELGRGSADLLYTPQVWDRSEGSGQRAFCYLRVQW
jgi:hypothetical protein